MTTDAEQALALVFRRFRDPPVPEDDLVKAMSLTLNWTKPSKAANLLDRGVNAGLLERGDDGYAPAFDPGEVDVEFGFDPPDELFEPVETREDAGPEDEPPAGADPALEEGDDGGQGPVLEALIDRIADAVGEERRRAVAAVNAKQEDLEGQVTLPVAALLVAREHRLEVREAAEDVLEELRASA